MKYNHEQPKAPTYTPEKVRHRITVLQTVGLMLAYHAVSWILYELFLRAATNQMMFDEFVGRARWTMFAFSLLGLLAMSVVLTLFYFKNGERKRAFLSATSVEVRGAENVSEGYTRYRKLALTEGLICAVSTGILWLVPTLFYAIALSTSGIGFGYGEAWGIEKFFVGFFGLCEPFQSPLIGHLIGLGIHFSFQYFGRLLAHKKWDENRIRR